jgi:uncharacterized protein YjbI with pentapeptide repeats
MIQKQDILLKDWLLQRAGKPIDKTTLVSNEEYFKQNRKNFTKEGKLNYANCNFEGQDLRGVNLSNYDISWCKIKGTKVDRAEFEYILSYYRKGMIDITGVDIHGLDLRGIDLHNLDMFGVDFSNTAIDRSIVIALIDDAKVGRVSLRFTDMSNQDLSGGFIFEPSLGLTGFEYFDLESIDLEGCNFSGANLSGARLDNSNLKGAQFVRAVIKATYARSANFEGANLSNSVLCSSDFTGSNFDHAILTGAEV